MSDDFIISDEFDFDVKIKCKAITWEVAYLKNNICK
jgi:hypothetical protein